MCIRDRSDIERLEDRGKALRELGELSDVKIPKVTVPKTGVAPVTDGGTMTPATTPATSEVEQVGSTAQAAGEKVKSFTRVLRGVGDFVGVTKPIERAGSAIRSVLHPIQLLKKNLKELYGKFKESGGAVGLFARSMKLSLIHI